jgi:hypothetical protein
MKWIDELDLTRNERALVVAALCMVKTDITPTMENVGNFSIEFVKKALHSDCVMRIFFSLDPESLIDVASLNEKIYG